MPAFRPVSFLSFSLHLTAAQLGRGLLIILILLASGFSEEPGFQKNRFVLQEQQHI